MGGPNSYSQKNCNILVSTQFRQRRRKAPRTMSMLPCDYDDILFTFYGVKLLTYDDALYLQSVSDLFICLACFSILLEFIHFLRRSSSSHFRFSSRLFLFGSLIILCCFTHLFSTLVYPLPYLSCSSSLMIVVTVLKVLTAIVSIITPFSLPPLSHQIFGAMVLDDLLAKKTRELGLMKKKEMASRNVTMLSREIRKSLDTTTIWLTTLVGLSRVLILDNCAVWMPIEANSGFILTHELKRRNGLGFALENDDELVEILRNNKAKVLGLDSRLRSLLGSGEGVAIRLPMLRVHFDQGVPKMVNECYGVLVLVFPGDGDRAWGLEELEIVEAVADQVAVALLHASIAGECVLMRDKLVGSNVALLRANKRALMANEAMHMFMDVISRKMRESC